ncbi:glycosyltransferase family 2 protein [Weissella diestrammenae]|uniref:Glycosyltransferase family 2 protein n=1 Tax=Weissella diestrammenae TaxID=1162633 RepID=A0A7G9T516_9LACO|nr:glycosyltransferase family 2 protein [Weissella diestrammenae]MCM0582914.1 glycosyltransferase family 2 protein [Weissella diestrammenae]QNN75191.1 glycosyltransferase family 2 protein [Weissella diestrammenae]
MVDVSVVIPAYKSSNFIEETVQSVLTQKGVDFEVIVSLQGPEDGSREILNNLQQKYDVLKVLDAPEGAAKENFTFVSNQAMGKYIKLLPSDDVLLPGILKRQFDLLESHSGSVVTASLREIIDENNQVIKKSWGLMGLSHPMPGAVVMRKVIASGINVLGEPGGVTMLKSAFDQAGGWDFTRPYTMDLETYLHVLAFGDFVPDRQVGVKFRISSGQWTAALQDVQAKNVKDMNADMARRWPEIVTKSVVIRGNIMADLMQFARGMVFKLRRIE